MANPAAGPHAPGGTQAGGATRRVGVALVAFLACILVARPASGAEAISLSWNDCRLGPTHSTDRVFDCLDDTSLHELYVAFTMPQAVDSVIAVEIVIDIQQSSAALPSWWRFDVGGCRENSIDAAADFPGVNACVNMWQGAALPAIAEMQGYLPGQPGGLPSQARLRVAASVRLADARSLDATSTYYAARIIINSAKTVGPPTCVGCDKAACLVLNSILIGRKPGSPGGDVVLQTPGAGDANWALWRSGAGASCAAVPTRNRTWGEIKSLYR